jgi:hypothetical protein
LVLAQNECGSLGKITHAFDSEKIKRRILIAKYDFYIEFISKEQELYKQKERNKTVFLAFYKIPFESNKKSICQIWSKKFQNAFIDFTISRTTLTMKNAINEFLKIPQEKRIFCLDERIKNYSGAILNNF